MKRMFHGKFMIVTEVQPIAKIKTITTNVNVVDVNVIIRNKAIKEHGIESQGKQRMLLIGIKKND